MAECLLALITSSSSFKVEKLISIFRQEAFDLKTFGDYVSGVAS